MGSIATIVTLGYGSFGSVNLLPTLGYSFGTGVVTLTPDAISTSVTAVAPSISSGLSLTPDTISANATIVAPTITVSGTVTLTPSAIVANCTIIVPDVTGGVPTIQTINIEDAVIASATIISPVIVVVSETDVINDTYYYNRNSAGLADYIKSARSQHWPWATLPNWPDYNGEVIAQAMPQIAKQSKPRNKIIKKGIVSPSKTTVRNTKRRFINS